MFTTHEILQETALARRVTRHPKCWPILLVWVLRPLLSRNPPDEVGKGHTMRLAICRRVPSSFSPPRSVARGGEVPGPAGYTIQASPFGVPSHELDARAGQYRHPGLVPTERAYCTIYDVHGASFLVQRARTFFRKPARVQSRRYERGQRTSPDGRGHWTRMPGLDSSDRTPALNPVYHTQV
jgi:hypothetical protein